MRPSYERAFRTRHSWPGAACHPEWREDGACSRQRAREQSWTNGAEVRPAPQFPPLGSAPSHPLPERIGYLRAKCRSVKRLSRLGSLCSFRRQGTGWDIGRKGRVEHLRAADPARRTGSKLPFRDVVQRRNLRPDEVRLVAVGMPAWHAEQSGKVARAGMLQESGQNSCIEAIGLGMNEKSRISSGTDAS